MWYSKMAGESGRRLMTVSGAGIESGPVGDGAAESVRIFGLSSWSILAPQALMGVASVALLYRTVRRHFGATAGLLAGAVAHLLAVGIDHLHRNRTLPI